MKRLVLLTLLCASAFAGVQIAGPVYTPFNSVLFTGTVRISGPRMITVDGRSLVSWQKDFQVTNGVITPDIILEPNDTSTPTGTSYSVRFTPANPSLNGNPWTDVWVIPTSSTPLSLGTVRVVTLPSPGVMILPSQISGGTAQIGSERQEIGRAHV